ncbi:hypothetical protein K8T06_11490, partial [bacterium]|nr:hypothetical protein [bacterium]
MRFKIILSFVIFTLTFISGLGFVTASDDTSDKPVEKVQKKQGYALVMANGTKIKVSRYEIDQEKGTVFYKSKLSGLSATFPLERIKRVVKYDINLVDVPDDAMPLFIPEQTIQSRDDDGGIPILFKVKKTIVGGG